MTAKDVPVAVCAFTSICEEDSGWVPQYLAEVERLALPFAVHLDRCSLVTHNAMAQHRLCIGTTEQNDQSLEFTEQHKQGAFDLVAKAGFDWALAWDVDETWERDAPTKLAAGLPNVDHLQTYWLNLWSDRGYVRIDGPFAATPRVKLYRLNGGRQWRFDHPITNGAKLQGCEPTMARLDLMCLHHGLMTHDLRLMHKARWDRIYTAAVGANPYGLWAVAIDPTIEPVVIRHGYL